MSGALKNPVRQLADFRHDKIEQWRAAKGKGYIGIPSSLDDVNRYLGGYRAGVMLVLGGFRGEGKSTLARQEAFGIAQKGYKTLVCSLEDPGDIAAAGIAGNYANRSVFHLDTGADDQAHIDQIDYDWASLSSVPLHITSGSMTIEDIETAAMIHKARHGLDFIVIDHIQFITPYKMPGMDRNGTVATYSQRIVAMLTKHGIPGLILSQLSRDSEKESRKPRLSDLRDSGCIEQDARAVMLLYFNAQDGHHRLEIAKNNFGISGKTFKIKREDGRQRFTMIGEV
jgi:replicative DNA helicase